MSSKDIFYGSKFKFSSTEEKAYCREELIYNVTEDLMVILEGMGVSKKTLAVRLGKSRSYITQLLSGSRNMTLGSLSDICFALGFKPKIKLPVQELVEERVEDVCPAQHSEWTTAPLEVRQEVKNRQTLNIIDRRDKRHWKEAA